MTKTSAPEPQIQDEYTHAVGLDRLRKNAHELIMDRRVGPAHLMPQPFSQLHPQVAVSGLPIAGLPEALRAR